MAKITEEYKGQKILEVKNEFFIELDTGKVIRFSVEKDAVYVHNINGTEIVPSAKHSLPGVKIM